ncbi:UAP56-interacting export factor 1 [Hibiscus trionum]|uniref:UAP56-interacting export factor 1 n=1 Tax=Hibiscus trionum TaxID=183268 RepID=A0A9W7MVB8_HIBTR|nr:UAP56-interacting export factor 1 [Hibiscus trionum]
MAAKPLTAEAIALTEKKMGMTLDDIIKMSKTTNKTKKWRRVSNKSLSQKPLSNAAKDKALKARWYMDSRFSVRQGVLAQRRSNIQGNQFTFAAEVAQWAAVAPLQVRALNGSRVANFNKPRFGVPPVQRRAKNGGFTAKPHHQQQQHGGGNVATKQRPHTLDLLFANMKEERTRVVSHQTNGVRRNDGGQQRRPWKRGRFGN